VNLLDIAGDSSFLNYLLLFSAVTYCNHKYLEQSFLVCTLQRNSGAVVQHRIYGFCGEGGNFQQKGVIGGWHILCFLSKIHQSLYWVP